MTFGAMLAAPVALADGEALFNSKPCVACHAVDNKLVGPSLKEVAAKYDGEEGAVATVAGHIKNGISGLWGPIPMPANQVTDDEATQLAEWVLSLK
tara:strand:- start:1964 stop:2251 length:288 start_codon:yes stop_codon:yes gene_type:complete